MTVSGSRDHRQPTDEDEGEANEEGQDVSPQRFVVLSIALGKDAQARVDVIFAQCLGVNTAQVIHSVHSGNTGGNTADSNLR